MMRRVRVGLLALFFSSISQADGAGALQPVCGRLSREQGLPVLELWGSPRDAGFAQGYLCAEQIIKLLDEYVLSEEIVPSLDTYRQVIAPQTQTRFSWPAAATAELEGILAGIKARLGDKARSGKLEREIELGDLYVCNTLADWFGYFCSSISIWGELTTDGETITARNLDFPWTPTMASAQVVIIYRGENLERPWIGVGWPGLVGVYTAMNRDGVTMLMHDARGLASSRASGFVPRSWTLREALEGAKARTFIEDVSHVFETHPVMVGNNIHVSAPRPATGQPTAVIFEFDGNLRGDGVTRRTARDSEPKLANALFCTNHHRLRQPPRRCQRYQIIAEELAGATEKQTKYDAAAALELIAKARDETTLHTVALMPKQRAMLVRIPPIQEKPVLFKLDDWLAKPK